MNFMCKDNTLFYNIVTFWSFFVRILTLFSSFKKKSIPFVFRMYSFVASFSFLAYSFVFVKKNFFVFVLACCRYFFVNLQGICHLVLNYIESL